MRSRPLALVPGLVAAGMLATSFLAAPAAAVPAKVIFDIPLTGADEIPSPGSPSGSRRRLWGGAGYRRAQGVRRLVQLGNGGSEPVNKLLERFG